MLILTVAAVAVIVDADGISDRDLKWALPTSELVDGAWIVLILIGSVPLWTASMAPIKMGVITAVRLVSYMSRSPFSTRHMGRDFRKIPVTRRSLLQGFIFCGTVVLTAKSRAFGDPLPPPDPASDWWLIPEDDISWWPAVARPSVLGEQLYKAHDIGPRDTPEPDALQEGAATVSTFAALQTAVNAAEPGEVIALEGGIKFLGRLTIPNIGTAERPVIIRSNPTDQAQAILFNGYSQFVTPNTGQWELFDEATKIWRSTGTSKASNYVVGHLVRTDGAIIYLFPYQETHFFSSSYGASGYRGPGVYHDGTRLYIRLENPDEFQSAGLFNVIPEGVDDDPNDLVIYVHQGGTRVVHITGDAAFVHFQDIVTFGGGFHASAGGSGWDFLRCQIHSTNGPLFFRFGNYSNITFRYGACRMHFGQWLDRDEHKSTSRGYRSRTHIVLFSPIEGTTENCWFEDSRMTDYSDGMFGGGTAGRNSGTRRCYQRYIDDTQQIGGGSFNIEHARNIIVGTPLGWNQGGDSPIPGSLWYHHNVFILDYGILWQYAGITSTPRRSRTVMQTHGLIGDHPVKFYNNTVIVGGFSIPRLHYKSRTSSLKVSSPPHYVLNNVIYRTYRFLPSTNGAVGGTGAIEIDIRVDGNTDRFNGNAWGQDANPVDASFLMARRSPADQTSKRWNSLAAFKADTSWSNGGTYNYETNGVEIADGRDAFVDFDAGDFQPKHDSSIAGMTPIDLEALASAETHGWEVAPELESAFVGAIPPLSAPLR